jgi:hypothetical protein
MIIHIKNKILKEIHWSTGYKSMGSGNRMLGES